jgi:glycosyltransferase involved in cell wall biosynthesis
MRGRCGSLGRGQICHGKEIVVVDGGSAEGTLAVARQFESKEVVVVTQPNQEAAAARNKAFSLESQRLRSMLNADDLLSPDNVAPQMQTARQITDGRTPTKRKFIPTPLRADLAPIEWLTRKREEKLHMQAATWLASRELTEAAGLWDSRLLEGDDGEYFFRVIHASNGIRFVPQSRITASPQRAT